MSPLSQGRAADLNSLGVGSTGGVFTSLFWVHFDKPARLEYNRSVECAMSPLSQGRAADLNSLGVGSTGGVFLLHTGE